MSAQKEQLKAIATKLSEERQKKSISLEEIAAKTYIPQRLLVAIEDANLDRLPEPVFIQGFIRRFGDAIGLDGTALSKEFTVNPTPLPAPTAATLISNAPEPQVQKPNGTQFPKAPEPSIEPRSEGPAPTPQIPEPPAVRDPQPIQKAEPPAIRDPQPIQKAEPPAIRDPQPVQRIEPIAARDPISEPRLSTDDAPSRLPLIALAAAIGLGVIGVLASTFANRAPEKTPVATAPATKPASPPAKPVQPNASQVPKSPAPAASASPSPSVSPSPTGPVNVKMDITSEEAWVQVVIDGNVAYDGTLTKGTQKIWSGKQVVIDTGNAGGVSLSYNNGAAKKMGADGEVQTATFPPAP